MRKISITTENPFVSAISLADKLYKSVSEVVALCARRILTLSGLLAEAAYINAYN